MRTSLSAPAADPHESGFHPGFARLVYRVLHVFSRLWFRFALRGGERVPRRNVLFVGNHSGIGIADVLCIAGAGDAELAGRRIVGMMHDLFIDAPLLGRVCRGFGAVRANREAARESLRRGHDVICYPGGNLDSCRPVTAAREVVFGDHRGYARLALEQRVPIVPLATIGSHFTYVLLPVGDRLARWLHRRGLSRDERLPVPLALLGLVALIGLAVAGWIGWVWILAGVAALVVPNPVRITTEALAPIDVWHETRHITDPEARVEAAHALVHGRLQAAVATLRH